MNECLQKCASAKNDDEKLGHFYKIICEIPNNSVNPHDLEIFLNYLLERNHN